MFRHVVMFKWADGVGDDDIAAVSAGLDRLPGAIADIRDYRHGSDVRVNDDNFDYVVVADFDAADGYLVYRDHPAHQQVLRELLAGRVAARAAVQYTF